MPITVIFIILGVVISVLLVILIKKIGSNTNANIIFPSFPPDSGDSDIIPNPAPNTNQNISQNTSQISQNTSQIAQNTTPTQTQPANTFNLHLYGTGFDCTKLSTTPTKLLSRILWTNTPTNELVNTLNLTYNLDNGIISGLSTSSSYSVIINLTIFADGNPASPITTFSSQNKLNVKLGIGISEDNNNNVVSITDSESTIPNSSYKLIGLLNIDSTADYSTTQAIPYIYIDNASLLSGKNNVYADLKILITKK